MFSPERPYSPKFITVEYRGNQHIVAITSTVTELSSHLRQKTLPHLHRLNRRPDTPKYYTGLAFVEYVLESYRPFDLNTHPVPHQRAFTPGNHRLLSFINEFSDLLYDLDSPPASFDKRLFVIGPQFVDPDIINSQPGGPSEEIDAIATIFYPDSAVAAFGSTLRPLLAVPEANLNPLYNHHILGIMRRLLPDYGIPQYD